MTEVKESSFIGGFSFIFEDEGKTIETWFSTVSGLEKVYVDTELVCSQRNLAIGSTNSFVLDGNEYTTNLKAVSLLKGPWVCTLSKNGAPFQGQKLSLPESITSRKKFLTRLFWYFSLAIVFGVVKGLWGLPGYSTYFFCSVTAVWIFWYYPSSFKGLVPEAVDLQDG